MKRFYTLVSVSDTPGGFGIGLDGKPVKTPAGKILAVDKKSIAEILMLEWQAQEKEVIPHLMPANQLVMTSLDGIRTSGEIIKNILPYAETDLVFYQSETEPYKANQEKYWNKWIEWVGGKFSIKLKTTQQIETLEQPIEFAEKLKAWLENLNHLQLTIFESLVDDTSSVILALAFFENAADIEDIYQAVFLEDLIRAEIYDEEKYGAAPDQEKKRAALKRNLDASQKLIREA